MITLTPLMSALLVGAAGLVTMLLIWGIVARRSKKRKKRTGSDVTDGYTIILLRGGGPQGGVLRGCQFEDGKYSYNADSDHPHLITYDGRFVRKDALGGEPFMFYDVEAQSLVQYDGECRNDRHVTIVHHDETAEDVSPAEAAKYREGSPDEPGTVARKLNQLWRRWGGARLWAEKNTDDWGNIQGNTPGWLALLNKWAGFLILLVLVVLVALVIVVVVST